MVLTRRSYTQPDDLAVLKFNKKLNTGEIRDITSINNDLLSGFEFPPAEMFFYQGGYGDQVQGWIIKPINFVSGKTYPLAFLIHGGPEGAWTHGWSYGWNPQIWANHGYVVIMINFHGSTGMGLKFQDAVRNDWGGVPYSDLMTGLDYAISKYSFIDPNRICAAGGSYGGYMVNWIQGQTNRFKCLITHDGAFSTVSKFYATDELWFQKAEFCPKDKTGCNPFDGKEIRIGYEKFCPEMYVNNWSTPHLVIHGGMDYRVPLNEGISLFTALQVKRVPSRFLFMPNENHWTLRPENGIKWYEEVLLWMDSYTQIKN